MSHSPAPWKLIELHHDYDPPNFTRLTIVDAQGYGVATVIQRNPNTDLLTAAPDLLEACKLVIQRDNEMYKYDSYYAMSAEDRDFIEDAIRKAENSAPE